jgi:ribose transport system substrate-binding protein
MPFNKASPVHFTGVLPAPSLGRRSFLRLAAGALALPLAARAEERRFRIGFANLTEDPGVRLEGLGFTGADVRSSFVTAARGLPVTMVLYDNDRNREKTLANASDAIARKLDLYILYCNDSIANAEIAKQMKAAGIPVLAVIYPVPGAPLYGPDNTFGGKIAGEALAKFGNSVWRSQPAAVALVGDLSNGGDHVPERSDAIATALKERLPAASQTRLDSKGNSAQADMLVRRFAAAQPSNKMLIAALDDTTALITKAAVEVAGRTPDTAIVSQGCDRSIHGGSSDKKELDPNNRGSILIGSVAYKLDRYGYDVLPLALKMLRGEAVLEHSVTHHVLVTASTVFALYPPIDMN